jgi:hypothetical protein
MRLAARAAVALAALLQVSCGESAGEPQSVRWLDRDVFVDEIQPIMAERCANPSCHGRPERPLSLYSSQAYRADASRSYLREPIDDQELTHNYTACCVFAGEGWPAEDSLLLRKARGAAVDTYHGGGVIFPAASDDEFRVLLRWVEAEP